MKLNSSFWQSKRALVTGHTGFKGSWLTCWLKEMGADVFGLALAPNTSPNMFEALNLENDCNHRILDIRERKKLDQAVKEIDPEIVFHMAAQPLVRDSYSSPIETYETNVMGTAHLLHALTSAQSVRSVVIVTTDKCYENREWVWPYRESDPVGGHDPYSSSKACAEILTASFRRSFFSHLERVGIATVRAGNVIGGGDWSRDRLIPDVVRAIKDQSTLEIRNPESIRPWQHVLCPIAGYMLLAEKLWENARDCSEAFNFAPSEADCVPVRVLLEYFGNAWGTPLKWSSPTLREKLHEAHFLKLDASKAKQKLGWNPGWDLQKSLAATAEWYRGYYEDMSLAKRLAIKQIHQFCESL